MNRPNTDQLIAAFNAAAGITILLMLCAGLGAVFAINF